MSTSPQTFRLPRIHYVAVIFIFINIAFIAAAKPLILGWFLLLPLYYVYVIMRSRTVLDDSGVTAVYPLRGSRQASWDSIQGFRFGRRHTYACTESGDFILPGISFNSIPELAQASQGRIHDVIAEAHKAAEDKITLVHRDGYMVMMDKEDYTRRQAEHSRPSSE